MEQNSQGKIRTASLVVIAISMIVMIFQFAKIIEVLKKLVVAAGTSS